MHKVCPDCAVVFEREHGYYLNSMFIAYGLGFLIMVPSAVLLAMRNVSIAFFTLFLVVEVIIITPILFRYSRVLWLHTDQTLDPRPLPGVDMNSHYTVTETSDESDRS
jgi:hypothetical protein